jgi:general secretion pathway protein G
MPGFVRASLKSRGYTIVELAIVLAVLGALVVVAIPVYQGYRERVTMKSVIADIMNLQLAIDDEIAEFGVVPDSIAHLPQSKMLDPWGNPYHYLNVSDSAPPSSIGKARKDKNLVPINSDYDLYSSGADGVSKTPLTAAPSQDDIVRANDGAYVGLASEY